MSFPPFPSKDLAKLVLGYLAEEHLMTVYDEFLQASPYLDALRNEYDRIFMTSLKSILAEYRAVKILVDTCRPYLLRKKIFQFTNLPDVVKFLITNVDINRIQLLEVAEKASIENQKVTITPKPNGCDVCHASKLATCVCKGRPTDVQPPENMSASHVEASTLQTSVETTPLADLPGNTTRKKHVKVLEKDSIVAKSNLSSGQSSDTQSISCTMMTPEEYLAKCQSPLRSDHSTLSGSLPDGKTTDPLKSKPSIEEFDDVFKSVVDKNKTPSGLECRSNHTISNTSTLKGFVTEGLSGRSLQQETVSVGTTAVADILPTNSGESQNATYNVPDSSTSENPNVRAPMTKDLYNDNNKRTQSRLMLQVSHVNDNIKIQTCRTESKPARPPKIVPKSTETRIQIISDVKVGAKCDTDSDNFKNSLVNRNNATSTPLMQMQTIMINGTSAYKHTPALRSYTKDEIMAMPTVIVVPASGTSQIQTSAHCEANLTPSCGLVSKPQLTTSTPVLEPLVIDVPPNIPVPNNPGCTALPDLTEQRPVGSGLVKTVGFKNASVPKDNVISLESNTPQVLPPTKKSSSTPRRTSHVRVLDFATPRRILHETINEQVSSQSSDPPLEVILSGSPNVVRTQTVTSEVDVTKSEVTTIVNIEGNNNDSGSTKENNSSNKVKQSIKYDWDADLRALIANEHTETKQVIQKPKPKSSNKKRSKDKTAETSKTAGSDKTEKPRKGRPRKKSPKNKRNNVKRIEESDESPPDLDSKSDIVVKPTVNIIGSNYHEKTDLQDSKNETESNKSKSHDKDKECIETPEAERLSLQNVIGAKLNISDLLETPYKQALYDIQMETPRFLGPDIPGEPVSDIKISNIPTPRFLNTPKAIQATPSSYTSRPSDYSSGASYYKPDDQDYMPVPDLMICPVTSSKEDLSIELSTEKYSDERKSRPVRQCTKNVSYYKNSGVVYKRDVEDNVDVASSCSEAISVNSSLELKYKTETLLKTPRVKSQSLNRTESKKKSCRKKKSPKDSAVKERIKSFMKIKPRCTPKKDTPTARHRKKLIQSPHSKGSPSLQHRKRTSIKDNLLKNTPVMVALPTKSRRKSSTPRKINCTKNFNCESSGHDSPETIADIRPNVNREKAINTTQDSDNEQLALRWSDDGSQDAKTKDGRTNTPAIEIENINKIQDFINSSDMTSIYPNTATTLENSEKGVRIESDGTLHQNLMKRGFDIETAKIIERELLDETPLRTDSTSRRNIPITVDIVETKKDDSSLEKIDERERSITNEMQTVEDDGDEDEIEFSIHECNEESKNYIVFKHDDTKEICHIPPTKLKDNYTMEICIDDVTMRLRAIPFSLVLDQDPLTVDQIDYSYKETELAVESISNMDRLYTPLKDTRKAQCFEIFDSTLTSLDTPLKAKSPVRPCEATVTELVLEAEKESKDKTTETRKRKRQTNDEPANSSKRTKPDAELLLKTANIQNIDIETVLTKLHGH